MASDKNHLVRSQSHLVPIPVRKVTNVERHLSYGGWTGSGCRNVAPILEETDDFEVTVSSEDVRGADSGDLFTCLTKSLNDKPTSNVDLETQLIAANSTSLDVAGKTTSTKGEVLHGPEDFSSDTWRGIEHYLRQRTRDTDPESLSPKKKPFYRRTWFACSIYATLLALLVAAILALAFTRSVVMPGVILDGEVIRAESGATPLQQKQIQEDLTVPIVQTGEDSSLLQLVSDATTIGPEIQTTPVERQTTSGSFGISARLDRSKLRLELSLPGPLQRFFGGDSS